MYCLRRVGGQRNGGVDVLRLLMALCVVLIILAY